MLVFLRFSSVLLLLGQGEMKLEEMLQSNSDINA